MGKYEEALERAKKIEKESPEWWRENQDAITEIFPELTESEDERIRKWLINKINGETGVYPWPKWKDKVIAWLEKYKGLFEYYDWKEYKDKPVEIWNAYIHGKAVGLELGKNVVKNSPTDYGSEKQKKPKIYWNPTEEDVALFNKAITTNTTLSPQDRAKLDIIRMNFKRHPYIEQKEQKPAVPVLPCSATWFEYDEQKPAEQNSISGNSENPNNHTEWSEEEKRKLNRIYAILGQAADTHAFSTTCRLIGDKEAVELQDFLRSIVKPQVAEWSEEYREEDLRARFAFYTYKDEDNTLYLSNVFVDEAYRNKGFGTQILKAAEKVAESIGATTICLKVKQDSTANAWYRKHGYGYVTFEGDYDWLEKKLEYLKPTKQEWSEKDEEMLDRIVTILSLPPVYDNKACEKMVTWLKSLRPQPHWKPTEKQINKLSAAIAGYEGDWGEDNAKPLRELFEQLKKL